MENSHKDQLSSLESLISTHKSESQAQKSISEGYIEKIKSLEKTKSALESQITSLRQELSFAPKSDTKTKQLESLLELKENSIKLKDESIELKDKNL